MSELGTDRQLLTTVAYPDSTNLRARQSIYDFKAPAIDWWAWVLGHVDWPSGASVLDVGCGPGNYLAELAQRVDGLQLCGVDLSRGMATEAATFGATLVGDVCALPVRSGSIDRLLAPHMLYHAPDLDRGAGELRRVLKPGGTALVVTNDRAHTRHLFEQLSESAGMDEPTRFIDRFTLTNGLPLLQRHFEDVAIHELRGALIVPEADPVVRYADSCRSLYEPQLPAGTTWTVVMEGFAALVAREIDANGVWRTPTHSGVFVCR